MRILFVSECVFAQPQGSKTVATAHYKALSDLFGKENIDIVYVNVENHLDNPEGLPALQIPAKFCKAKRVFNTLSERPFFLDRKGHASIVRAFKRTSYDLIWFDNSCYGREAEAIRRIDKDVRMIAFYHDVKLHRELQYYRLKHSKLHFLSTFRGLVSNEILMSKTVDLNLFLNDRDANALSVLYGSVPSEILPVTFVDTADFSFSPEKSSSINLLFIGCYSWPNIQGLEWFVENVMPRLDAKYKLLVVGLGMEKLRSLPLYSDNKSIEVIGGVKNLSEWYMRSDIVLGPIFVGDGMKTKTAEALMYGKAFIGTDEALEGYENSFFVRANTSDEFVSAIENIVVPVGKVNFQLRQAFLDYYSEAAAKKYISTIIDRAFNNAMGQN